MSKNAHLFVYGTLMSAAASALGRAQRQRLAREGRLLGVATTAGRLVDLGRYPGLVSPEQPGDVVHGEVLELADPQRSLRWLDDYEGIFPGDHAHNEYARDEREVVLATGDRILAWVYLYRQPITSAKLIASGSWLAHAARQARGR